MEPIAAIIALGMINPKDNALAIGAASFASTSKDTADSAGRQATPEEYSKHWDSLKRALDNHFPFDGQTNPQYKVGDKFRLPKGNKKR